ncbi:MAG: Rieske (2Fe-2S) protein [Melioribacteraceae bacterium]|nr:Rieske (2Fe-2S) protein [Melioribacteraceae bacterium]
MSREKKENINIQKEPLSRRGFFNKLWIGLGTLAGIEVLGISLNFLLSSSKMGKNDLASFIVAGKVDDFKPNSVTPFRSGKFYLSRLNDGGFLAMSLTCTHLGCSVGWNKLENTFICPCHSSSFEINGDVTNQPAPRALDLLPVIIENEIVKVNPNEKTKRQSFSSSQLTYHVV